MGTLACLVYSLSLRSVKKKEEKKIPCLSTIKSGCEIKPLAIVFSWIHCCVYINIMVPIFVSLLVFELAGFSENKAKKAHFTRYPAYPMFCIL